MVTNPFVSFHSPVQAGHSQKRELAGKNWGEEGKCECLTYSQHIYMGGQLCGILIGPHGKTFSLVGLDQANAMWAPTGKSKICAEQSSLGIGTILDSKGLSFKWEEAVSDILSDSTQSNPSTTWE
ncbi:hypothetical protein O181_016323 [Austropuccinia psidii MF-1]|uniref:Uncharacterized protein n=1 Tax=Austropuccinia psidii MF-1 TaxID=1389203 RepID=A0A9Q3C4X2_9BASI|nr:hypothetical protein [Austropuccinia psidii MF-1]